MVERPHSDAEHVTPPVTPERPADPASEMEVVDFEPDSATTNADAADRAADHPTEHADPEERAADWKSVMNTTYFSQDLRNMARDLHNHDDEALIRKLTEEMEDNDGAALRTILVEFRRCQNAVAILAEEKSEDSFASLQVALERFFNVAKPYTSSEISPARPGTAVSARADTAIERSALGLRLKFLIGELQEMTAPLPGIRRLFEQGVVRTTLAQSSTGPLFGQERQQEMRGFLKQAEELYGSDGLKYSTKPAELLRDAGRKVGLPQRRINSLIGNIRSDLLRNTAGVLIFLAEVTGIGYVGAKATSATWNYFHPAAATAVQDPGTPNPNTGPNPGPNPGPNVNMNTAEAQDQAKVQDIFEHMHIEVKDKNLYVKFVATGTLTVNETLFVLMGSGTHAEAKRLNPIGAGGWYTVPLTAAEQVPGTELAVTIRGKSSVGSQNFLLPLRGGKTDYKTLKVR